MSIRATNNKYPAQPELLVLNTNPKPYTPVFLGPPGYTSLNTSDINMRKVPRISLGNLHPNARRALRGKKGSLRNREEKGAKNTKNTVGESKRRRRSNKRSITKTRKVGHK
jgi:hypothetical protein